MKQIDLHVHSHISDGTLSPSQLACYAKEKGLSAIALTDHDTVDGVEECVQKGKELGLTVIPGIELAATYLGREIHILGYYIDPQSPFLIEKLKSIVESRNLRNLQMLKKIEEMGFIFSPEDLALFHSSTNIFTRAHFATALLHQGYVSTREEAFDKYIARGKCAYVPRKKLTPKECISVIHEAGGLAVLAHPMLYSFDDEQIEDLVHALKEDGLNGLETLYCTHSKQDVLMLLNLCLKYKLLPTGGSDFHGDNKPGLDIGVGYGDLNIPYTILEALQKQLSR